MSLSGIVVSNNGTVYFSDTLNGRVREVLPDGIIKTIVGGGRRQIGQGSLSALEVSLPAVYQGGGLALSPSGELYLGGAAVYRLDDKARVVTVVAIREASRRPGS